MNRLAVTSGTHRGLIAPRWFSCMAPPNAVMSIFLNLSSVLLGSSKAKGRDIPILCLVELSDRYASTPPSGVPQAETAAFTAFVFPPLGGPYATEMATLPQRLCIAS